MMTEVSDLYQELILDHNRLPRNRRALASPFRSAKGYNPLCGDRLTVYLKIENNVVEEASFEGSGCAISTASASLMTEALTGKTVKEAKALFARFRALVTGTHSDGQTGPELGKLAAFSGVCNFPARVKCATLAWHTVRAVLEESGETVTTE